ncbi:MAG TPA: UvrD-helicase domain-containing protein, partial [Patescibacteria group bacterium]|nr:UvrD-helicase domain-containing protein [Patescibacteria group bacterium]
MVFNELQQKIIDQVEGVNLISAPVGTGKTTVLTERVVKALEKGIKPEEILCLTFTNRATEEMMEKLKKRITEKEVVDALTIKTFHGFCAYLVRAEAETVGVASDFIIFDEEERMEVLEGVLEKYPEYSLWNNGIESRKSYLNNIFFRLYKYRLNKIEKDIGCQVGEYNIDDTLIQIGEEYRRSLEEQNALDFDELVFLTVQILCTNQKIRKKWSRRFRFIQVDEFQDTHLSEYLVVKELAKTHRNISFIGDLDQTIYTWRGSRPFFIRNLVKHHFPKCREFHLETNYRFDQNILEAVKSFLKSLDHSTTKEMNSFDQGDSRDKKCIEVFRGYNFREEVDWVVSNIKTLREQDPGSRIAVLSRTNYLIKRIAEVFSQKNISHITVDKYEFFRKQEVKDIYAYLKIIFNRFDLESAYRVVKRPARNIGPATIKNIRDEGESIALKVSDFLNFKNYNFNEPFENLIRGWDEGRIIVLDTETTGTNVLKDELIQIYAVEVVNGKPGKDFHFFVKNTRPVGSSAEVHGLTDEFLQENGREPAEVLRELKDFIGGDMVAGHNIIFDLSILAENGKRHGVEFDFKEFYDTLDLS